MINHFSDPIFLTSFYLAREANGKRSCAEFITLRKPLKGEGFKSEKWKKTETCLRCHENIRNTLDGAAAVGSGLTL